MEVVALYVDEPRQVRHLPESVSRTASWLSILALVLGLTVAAASGAVLGSQIWHVKQQLDRQRRTKALVEEVGLPRSFVPKVRSSNRWAIGGSTGLVFGFFWFMWGLVHYRDQRRRSTYTIGEDPHCDHPVPSGALRANEARFPLVHVDPQSPGHATHQRFCLAFTTKMAGRVTLPNGPDHTLAELIRRDLAAPAAAGLGQNAYAIPIADGMRAELYLGQCTFRIASVEAEPPFRAPILDRLQRLPGRRPMRISPEVARLAAGHIVTMGTHLDAVLAIPDLEAHGRTLSKSRRLPRAFFTHMVAALDAYDRFVATVIKEATLEVTCGPGCTACCHGAPAGVRGCELLVLYKHYRRFPDFRHLHNRAVSQSDQLMEDLRTVSARAANTVMTDSRAFRRAYVRYMRRRLPCVFVDSDTGNCRVYEARPIPCRMHFSLNDPDQCWPDHPRSSKAVAPNLTPPPAITQRLDRIDEALGLSHITRILLPGLTELGSRVLKGKPLRTTNRVTGLRPARRRSKHRQRR